MLITIVHTANFGKVVLHKYPYEKIHLEQEGLEKLPPNDMLEAVTELFDYFAAYRKKSLITTSNAPLPQKVVVEMFMANEKFSQVTLGIDDDCVLVSRSAFLQNRSNSQQGEPQVFSENVWMNEVSQTPKSQVISITLIWRQDSYQGIEDTKHKLSFLLGVLQRREQHQQFLTNQILRIMEERQRLKKKIKDLFTLNIKESMAAYEEVRIKIFVRQIQNTAKTIRDQLPLFILLKRFQETWVKGDIFQIREYDHYWEGTIGSANIIGQPPKDFEETIKNKTLVMLPPKLAELPPVLYSDRVRSLLERGLSFNCYSIKQLLEKNRDIEAAQLYHTAYFLLKNNLAVDIYPMCHPRSYNLFFLRDLPQKSLIQKFNHKIFPGKNLLQTLKDYSKYKLALEEEETLKYLLIKGIVREVKIYIYRKYNWGKEELEEAESLISSYLQKYNMTDKDLNYMLACEPLSNREGMLLNNVFKYIKNHPKQWGFYFVEKI